VKETRKALSKKLRFEVFKRDSFTCQYCGKSAPDAVLQADHINPVANGGKNHITNLITACSDCNLGKGARVLSDDSVAVKQMRQLKELNERREQIKMIADWHNEVVRAEDQQVDAVAKRIAEIGSCELLESGRKIIRAAIKKYGLADVLAATEVSANQYLHDIDDREQRDKFINYIPRICFWTQQRRVNPDGDKIGYICAIASKKRFKCARTEVWNMVKDAHSNYGVPLDDVLSLVKASNGIMQFRAGMDQLLEGRADG
jgi:hypothetical protein